MTTLHLTTCSDHSRVDLTRGDRSSSTEHGAGHADRSRSVALEVRAFLALWDSGRRAKADTAHAALTPAARRLLDETAQARSERACNV
jgi:hypothetical protein